MHLPAISIGGVACFDLNTLADAPGVFAASGKDLCDHVNLNGKEAEIWKETRAKSVAVCVDRITEERVRVEYRKHVTSGFGFIVAFSQIMKTIDTHSSLVENN